MVTHNDAIRLMADRAWCVRCATAPSATTDYAVKVPAQDLEW